MSDIIANITLVGNIEYTAGRILFEVGNTQSFNITKSNDIDTLVKIYRGLQFNVLTCSLMAYVKTVIYDKIWFLTHQLPGPSDDNYSLIVVEDNLTSNSAANALSAQQGKVLNDALALKCPLDVGGKVPSANLPSYVDDVLEYADFASLPNTGETGKIYITLNTNLIYRWTGSAYVLIGDGNSVDVVGVGANAFVRYDQAQSLTTPQKTFAQDNIGVGTAIAASLDATINTQGGASYIVVTGNATDNNGKTYVRMTSASANTVTIPITLTKPISISQRGAGTTTLAAGAGVTLNGTLAFSAQHQTKTVIPVSAGVYDVVG